MLILCIHFNLVGMETEREREGGSERETVGREKEREKEEKM